MKAGDSTGIRLWVLPVGDDVSPAILHTCRSVLDQDESTRADQFKCETARTLFLLAHALLRHALSQFAQASPRRWAFAHGSHGKPTLANACDFPLHFNLSHTHGAVACAVSTFGEIGIDIEYLGRDVQISDFHTVLSPIERRELGQLAAEAQRRRFYEIWTSKEAYIKGLGLGLAHPLTNVTVTDCNGVTSLQTTDAQCADWQFRRYFCGPGHALAVAATNTPRVAIEALKVETVSCAALAERLRVDS